MGSHFNNPPWPSFWWSPASDDSVGAKASGGKNGMSRPAGCLKVKVRMTRFTESESVDELARLKNKVMLKEIQ